MHKAFRYRLYPDKTQEQWLLSNIGACRFVYNQALGWRTAAYNADGTTLSYSDTAYGTARSKAVYPWLKEADSASLQQSLRHLDTAYRNFFGSGAGFPRFKSRKACRLSYTTPMNGHSIKVGTKNITLPKAGRVRAVIHRSAPDAWTIRSATVSMERDGTWYCSVLYEYEEDIQPVSHPEDNAVGLDYKSDGLYVSSDGVVCGSPKFFRKSQEKLARAQRKLAKKQGSRKGETESSNYRKQRLRVARIHRHAASQRKDFLHKESLSIAKAYDLVCVEGLNMRDLSNKGFRNGKAMMDNGWGMFLGMLEYKLADRGKALVRIDKWYPSSQLCSRCGEKNPAVKDLRIRSWACPACGAVHDRDLNAASNILAEGIRVFKERYVGQGLPDLKPVESRASAMAAKLPAQASSAKQEAPTSKRASV